MDTPLQLKFELTPAEEKRYLQVYAEVQARTQRFLAWAGTAALAATGVVWGMARSWPEALWFLPAAAAWAALNSTFARSPEWTVWKLERSGTVRLSLRLLQSVRVDGEGVSTDFRGLLRRGRLPWARVKEAERAPSYWYFRSGGTQFIVPDRAFPTAESLAQFEAVVRERVPPHAWRDNADGQRGP